jgi:hypothetical protein
VPADVPKKDAWSPLYKIDTPDYAKARGGADDLPVAPDGAREAPHEFHVCTALNESAGGFCLVWIAAGGTDLPNLNALVGELIGMQDVADDNKHRWSVGVIRWMKSRDPQQLELGVQKLAPYAVAAGVTRDRARAAPEVTRGLLLPELINTSQPVTLITANVYDVGDSLILDIGGERRSVRLVKLLESTGSFAQYRFKESRRGDRATDSSAADDDGAKRFDKLWGSL